VWNPETWKAIAQFGVPFLILVAVGIGFWKGLWPFFMKQFDKIQDARERDQENFLLQLDRRDDVNKKQTEAIERLTDEIRRRN